MYVMLSSGARDMTGAAPDRRLRSVARQGRSVRGSATLVDLLETKIPRMYRT